MFGTRECRDKTLSFNVFQRDDKAFLETPGLTFEAWERFDESNNAYSYVTNLERHATHLLTVFADGSARFTAHTFLGGAVSSTYFGICSRTE